jgi:hypothetical protein
LDIGPFLISESTRAGSIFDNPVCIFNLYSNLFLNCRQENSYNSKEIYLSKRDLKYKFIFKVPFIQI